MSEWAWEVPRTSLSLEPKSSYSFLFWLRKIFVSILPSVKEPYLIFCFLHWLCPGLWHCDLSQLSNAVNNGVPSAQKPSGWDDKSKATFLFLSTLTQPFTLKYVIQSLGLGAPGKCFSFSGPCCSFYDYCSSVDIEIPA